jgi:hypothetical protein
MVHVSFKAPGLAEYPVTTLRLMSGGAARAVKMIEAYVDGFGGGGHRGRIVCGLRTIKPLGASHLA